LSGWRMADGASPILLGHTTANRIENDMWKDKSFYVSQLLCLIADSSLLASSGRKNSHQLIRWVSADNNFGSSAEIVGKIRRKKKVVVVVVCYCYRRMSRKKWERLWHTSSLV
jgi:hypothetical protein